MKQEILDGIIPDGQNIDIDALCEGISIKVNETIQKQNGGKPIKILGQEMQLDAQTTKKLLFTLLQRL